MPQTCPLLCLGGCASVFFHNLECPLTATTSIIFSYLLLLLKMAEYAKGQRIELGETRIGSHTDHDAEVLTRLGKKPVLKVRTSALLTAA